MPGAVSWSVFLASVICFACLGNKPKQHTSRFSFKKVSIRIECPDNESYYLIEFDNSGQSSMAFCFDRTDSLDLIEGKRDSLTKTADFHISQPDMQTLDTLLSSLPTRIDSERRRDAFRYILRVDGRSKIVSSDDERHVYDLLEVLIPYFPEDERRYDFYEFFKAFKMIGEKKYK